MGARGIEVHLGRNRPDLRGQHPAQEEVHARSNQSRGETLLQQDFTGTDCWALKEFFLMPDPVLETLGDLLSDIQFDSTPPLQVFSNIMATLPKKDGGVRTVAIATSLYRLLMELDHDEVQAFADAKAYVRDVGGRSRPPRRSEHADSSMRLAEVLWLHLRQENLRRGLSHWECCSTKHPK